MDIKKQVARWDSTKKELETKHRKSIITWALVMAVLGGVMVSFIDNGGQALANGLAGGLLFGGFGAMMSYGLRAVSLANSIGAETWEDIMESISTEVENAYGVKVGTKELEVAWNSGAGSTTHINAFHQDQRKSLGVSIDKDSGVLTVFEGNRELVCA